jgi:hypothetical protein
MPELIACTIAGADDSPARRGAAIQHGRARSFQCGAEPFSATLALALAVRAVECDTPGLLRTPLHER